MEAISNEIQEHIFDNTIWQKAVSIRFSDQILESLPIQDEKKRKLKDIERNTYP